MLLKGLSVVALSIVPLIHVAYFVQDIKAHQTSPATVAAFTWVIPYAAAATEWFRLGNRVSIVSRVLIVATNVVMALFLFVA